MTLATINREEAQRGRFFDARPAKVQEILRAKDPTVLACGPLGTGKTTCLLERVRACCQKYAGCRWLLLRSYRKWLTNSALVTWEEKVVVPGELLPDRIHRDHRSEYRFRNGSVVVVSGLDDPVAVRSADYDGAFILEATEVHREAVEEVQGRLRNGRMPYQQLLMDCNPGAPTHWLKQDADAGQFRYFESRHKDNPFLWDPVRNDWTPVGRQYMERLDNLTGSRRLRLKDGKWAQAEGVVYEGWDSAVHVVDAFDVPASWTRYWVIDFGFTNPFVLQWWAEDPDGRLYLYREIYRTGRLVEDHAAMAKGISDGEPKPRAVICDHDAEGRATFERHAGVRTIAADKDVEIGIQDVATRLRAAGDGKPRLFVFRNALCHEPDETLLEKHKPTCTHAEFDGYVWNPNLKKGEEPLKENDHGCDAARYLARHLATAPKRAGGGPPPKHVSPLTRLPGGTFG